MAPDPGPAAGVLSRALGRPVALEEVTVLREGPRSTVLRCRVRPRSSDPAGPARGAGPVPPTVVVKRLHPGSTLGYTDWAALRFLGSLAGGQGLAPRVLGGDAPARVVLLEDLGPGGSLDALLQAPPGPPAARAARDACLALAAQYARLHVASRGQEAAFARACAETPPAAPEGRHEEARRWTGGLERVRAWLDGAGCPVEPGLGAACERVAAVYAEPGPWLTFTHGDPAPTNNHVAPPAPGRGPAVSLLDFEYGAFRHALYDLTAWDVLCPLPRDLLAAMRRRYRAALGPTLPAGAGGAGDPPGGAFSAAWAEMVAFRALALLSWIPTRVLDANAPWVGDWTAREAILVALGRLRLALAGLAELAPIRRTAGRLEFAPASPLGRGRRPPEGNHGPRWPALSPPAAPAPA